MTFGHPQCVVAIFRSQGERGTDVPASYRISHPLWTQKILHLGPTLTASGNPSGSFPAPCSAACIATM